MEELIVLEPSHKDLIHKFEMAQFSDATSFETQMKTWDARWRPEALDHYLGLGWSFGVLKNHELRSFVLAQPFVFFRGLTQTLWVEWMGAVDLAAGEKALEVAYRWARDKHFQSLILEQDQVFSEFALKSSFPFEEKNGLLILKTSKMK